jgi:hypothetical protein
MADDDPHLLSTILLISPNNFLINAPIAQIGSHR